MSLDALFNPSSVVVLGGSERAGHGRSVLESLLSTQYAGQIAVVNPRYAGSQVLGVAAYSSLDEVPFIPDCLVSAVRPEMTLSALGYAADRGTRASVIISAGFAESGHEGICLQERISEIAEKYNLSVCGPNCMGIANYDTNFHPFAETPPRQPQSYKPNVAVIAQSGSICRLFMHSERINTACLVSAGNQAATSFTDYVRYFSTLDNIDVIVLFIESLSAPRDFFSATRAAAMAGKTVVACRTGATKHGSEALVSHTGRMAGDYLVFAAECRRNGVILCESLDELFETTIALSAIDVVHKPTPGLSLINSSGGENAHAIDLASKADLDWAYFSEETRRSLAGLLPDFGDVRNPLDVTGKLLFDPEAYERAVDIVAADPNVDVLVVILELPWPDSVGADAGSESPFAHTWRSAIRASQANSVPLIVCLPVGAQLHGPFLEELVSGGVAVIHGLSSTIKALRNVKLRAQVIKATETWRAAGETQLPDVNGILQSPAMQAILQSASQDEIVMLRESTGLDLLDDIGIRTAPRAHLPKDMPWQDPVLPFGFPVVAKIDAEGLAHKSDIGAVELGIGSSSELVEACMRILSNVRGAGHPEDKILGFTVSAMISSGFELLVGARIDHEMGPVVSVGIGGVYTEVLRSIRSAVAPITPSQALELMNDLRGIEILNGARGSKRGDLAAVADILARLSMFIDRFRDNLVEIDLNPVLVRAEGEGAVVVDSLFVLRCHRGGDE